MKLTLKTFEGTPQDLRDAGLQGFFELASEPNGDGTAAPVAEGVEFTPDVQRFLAMRVPASIRPTAEQIIREVLSWGDVRAKGAGEVPGGRYVRFNRRGSAYGAFLYLQPKRAYFRLDSDELEGRTYAHGRDVSDTNKHQVVVPLDDPAAVPEVLELARLAYERVA